MGTGGRCICVIIAIQFLVLLMDRSKAEVTRQNRHLKNAVKEDQGFQMFSMMDFPHKSLERYSLDPVQGLIYSEKDLGHINGILTDKDVIEDPTGPAAENREKNNKVVSLNTQTASKAKEQSRNDLPTVGKTISKRINPLKQRVASRKIGIAKLNPNSPLKKGPIVKWLASTIKPKMQLSRTTTEKLQAFNNPELKYSVRRNFPSNSNDPSEQIRAILESIDEISPVRAQPRKNSLREIQQTVAVSNRMEKQQQYRHKVSRSPQDRGLEIDKSIEKQLKSLKQVERPVRNPSKPNERDFFFFKDAFEYGTRLLARNLIKAEKKYSAIDTRVIPETPRYNTHATKENDLEKIKISVQENIRKMNPANVSKNRQKLLEEDKGLNDIEWTEKPVKATPVTKKPTSLRLSTESNGVKLQENFEIRNEIPSVSNKTTATETHEEVEKEALTTTEAPKTTVAMDTSSKKKNWKPLTTKVEEAITKPLNESSISATPSKTTQPILEKKSTKSEQSKTISIRRVKKYPSLPTKKVPVGGVRPKTLNRKRNIVTRGKPTIPMSEASRKKVFKLPEWKMPQFFYRMPCPKRADAMFRSNNNKVYAIDGNVVYVIGPNGIELGPLPLNFVWPEVQSPITGGYVRPMDRMLFMFFKNKYAAYINDRELVGKPSENSAIGLPHELTSFDAVSTWTGNGKAYYFKGKLYWRYNDSQNRMDVGYPKLIQRHWHNVPDNLDTAFIAPNSYLYFVKDGLIYKMHYHRASVQYRYPQRLSESCYDFFL